jgi:hypothetical protein
MEVHQYRDIAMSTFETSATVGDQGQVRVAGVPFEPGTRVNVTIRPAENGPDSSGAAEPDRGGRLLAALDKARNSESVGPLRRAELHDRSILH